MNKKESLEFLQSCIDSLKNISDEDRKRGKKIAFELNKQENDVYNDIEIILPNNEENFYKENIDDISIEMKLEDKANTFYKNDNQNKMELNVIFNYAA